MTVSYLQRNKKCYNLETTFQKKVSFSQYVKFIRGYYLTTFQIPVAATLILMGMIKHLQSSQNSKFAMPLRYLKKEFEMRLISCMQINIKVSYMLITAIWASKFPTRWYYHFWSVWSSILKALKITSLQYLYNTSKQKLAMEFISFMRIIIKLSTSWHFPFWSKLPHMSKVPNIDSW